MTYYFDTNIFLYAADPSSAFHIPSRDALELIAEGKITGVTSTETFQEVVYVGQREKRIEHALAIFDQMFHLIDIVLPITRTELFELRRLAEKYPGLEGRDLLHAAACITSGIGQIISYDTDFDPLQELQRITPDILISVVSSN